MPPYFENFGKRVIKTPKYYFTDTGLLSYLLGIETVEQVQRDPLVGSLFENLVVLEALKSRYNKGLASNLYFFRDARGNELDLLFKTGSEMTGIEIKSASTYNSSFKKGLLRFNSKMNQLARAYIIYNGDEQKFSDGIQTIHFTKTSEVI